VYFLEIMVYNGISEYGTVSPASEGNVLLEGDIHGSDGVSMVGRKLSQHALVISMCHDAPSSAEIPHFEGTVRA